MFNPDLHFTVGTFWALTPKGNSFYARQPITRSFKDRCNAYNDYHHFVGRSG